MTTALLPQFARAALEPRLPDWIAAEWWHDGPSMLAAAPRAEIAWVDMFDKTAPLAAIGSASPLRWLNSGFAGVDWLPLADLAARDVVLTNGGGLTANQVAEFALLTMLSVARGYRQIVRAQDQGHWLTAPSAVRELGGSRALVIGYGAIGQAIGGLLKAFGVDVIPVRRSGGEGALGPGEWQARLGGFDWVVLALPGTPDTAQVIGRAELAAMRREAVLVNVARAGCVDQPALVEALRTHTIAAAILDLTDPEPLPPGHPLWTLDNAHITMHLAGIPTPATHARAVERFVANLARFRAGEPLEAAVDLALGY